MIDEIWKKLTKEEKKKVEEIMEEDIYVTILQYIEHYIIGCETYLGKPIAVLEVSDYGEVVEQEYICHLCNGKVIAYDMDTAYLHVINNHLEKEENDKIDPEIIDDIYETFINDSINTITSDDIKEWLLIKYNICAVVYLDKMNKTFIAKKVLT